MFTRVQAGPYSVRGVSVGGVYTCLQVPELSVVLDAGIPVRSFAGTDRVLLSHCHADHASGLGSLLGIRRLLGKTTPPRVFVPAESAPLLEETLRAQARLHACPMDVTLEPLQPGDERELGHGLWVRAFRTHHPIASLGYLFFRRVQKLAAAYRGLPGDELARLRAENRPGVFETHDRLELAYATDTLSDVLDTAPEILEARVLVLECTFLDATRDVARARERSHLHLDELLARAERVRCEAVVLMHFSQSYPPAEVHALLAQRLPPSLAGRVQAFAPASGNWFG